MKLHLMLTGDLQECRDCRELIPDPYYWYGNLDTICSGCNAARWYARHLDRLFREHRRIPDDPPTEQLKPKPAKKEQLNLFKEAKKTDGSIE